MKWIPWSKDIEVPFDAAQAVYVATSGTMNSKMVGNGEHLFAAHTSGSVSSDDSYDVLGPNGERFEVKGLGNFRFNFENTDAKLVYERFMKISNELVKALDGSSLNDFYLRALDISSRPYLGIKKVFGRTYKNGRKPDIGLMQIATFLSYEELLNGSKEFVEIKLDDTVFVSVPRFIKLCNVAKQKIEREFEEIDYIFSLLDDECFRSPSVIEKLWDSIKPSEVLLSHCDYLVIVDKELGYIILDKDRIDEYVIFTGFSNGEAHFKTTKKLKEVIASEIVECDTTSGQLDFTKWFGNDNKKEQEYSYGYCNCLSC